MPALSGIRSTAPALSRLALPSMKASGLARSSARMVWSRVKPRSRPAAIPPSVSPRRTVRVSSPAMTSIGAAVAAGSCDGSGIATGSGAVSGSGMAAVWSSRGGSGMAVGSVAVSGSAGGGSGSRTTVLPGSTVASWIGGCTGAAAVCGVSSSAEYSRTSRPCPQSTSSRKVSSGCCTGAALVTRITGRPRASSATENCRSDTMPCGGDRPMRAKVSGDARRACSASSSLESLEMTGISASKGWSRCDRTLIWPKPSAHADSGDTRAATASKTLTVIRKCLITLVPRNDPETLAACSRLRNFRGSQRLSLSRILKTRPQPARQSAPH